MSTLTTTATYFRGGLSHVYTGGVGYDGAACVARYAFVTDANGAASLSFRTQRLEPDRNDNHYQPDTLNGFRWLVTREATGYEGACGAAGWQTVPSPRVSPARKASTSDPSGFPSTLA